MPGPVDAWRMCTPCVPDLPARVARRARSAIPPDGDHKELLEQAHSSLTRALAIREGDPEIEDHAGNSPAGSEVEVAHGLPARGVRQRGQPEFVTKDQICGLHVIGIGSAGHEL